MGDGHGATSSELTAGFASAYEPGAGRGRHGAPLLLLVDKDHAQSLTRQCASGFRMALLAALGSFKFTIRIKLFGS